MRILHIAPQNISDVPMTLVRAERALGHDSRLATFFRDPRGYDEDMCLELPLVRSTAVRRLKRWVSDPHRQRVDNSSRATGEGPPVWRPHGAAERWLVVLRERLWQPRIERWMREADFWNFDVYEFDAGLDFYRDGRIARRLRRAGKRIIVAYTGSDLRTRGIIPAVDAAADLRITFEWDHLDLDDSLMHVLFPFEPERFPFRIREAEGRAIRIGHAPTNRAAKGSDMILAVLQQLQTERDIEIVLIEHLPYREAIARKDTCDIFIDQIGDLGYGINALEALAMGIPTCTGLVPAFKRAYPDHPFVEVERHNLKDALLALIDDAARRRQLAEQGRRWLERHHDSRAIVQRIHRALEERAQQTATKQAKTTLTGNAE